MLVNIIKKGAIQLVNMDASDRITPTTHILSSQKQYRSDLDHYIIRLHRKDTYLEVGVHS